MAQTTLTYKDASGATQTLEASEGASYKIPNNRLCDASGNFTPAGDAAARGRYCLITDGTDTLGINDIDGVLDERLDQYAMTIAGLMAIDAGGGAGSQLVPLNVVSTAAPWLKVALYNSTNAMPAMDAAGRRGYVQLTDGTDSSAIEKVDAALSETGVTSIRTIASAFALDAGAGAGSQAVPLQVVTTTPNLMVSVLNGTDAQPAGDTAGHAIYGYLTDGTDTAGVNDFDTTIDERLDQYLMTVSGLLGLDPRASAGSKATPIACDTAGSLRAGVVPLGVSLVATDTAGAEALSASIGGTASKRTYLSGLTVTGLGATGATSVLVTTTGLETAQLKYTVQVPAGATLSIVPLNVQFNPPLRAAADATAIVVTVESFGTGNTVQTVNVTGFEV